MQEAWEMIQDWSEHPPALLWVNMGEQSLRVCGLNQPKDAYAVSTALRGSSCKEDSYATPSGWHRVVERYGRGCSPEVVFSSRRVIAENPNPQSEKDQICSRILRLAGMEWGHNWGPGCDSFRRYIYIHGTNHESQLGQATSQGCIRMGNTEIARLFDQLEGQRVYVHIS